MKLCFNCLSRDHGVRDCYSTNNYDRCSHKHHKLIHHESPAVSLENSGPKEQPKEQKEGVSLCSGNIKEIDDTNTVLLGTARVMVEGPTKCSEGRFLIDSGSQMNFVSQKFCKKVGLTVSKFAASVQALGGISQTVRGLTTFTAFSSFNKRDSFPVTALVLEKITGTLPQNRVHVRTDTWLSDLPLADREFDQPGPIEGLFGAEIFAAILGLNHRKGFNGGPIAMETSMGYVVMGRVPSEGEGVEKQTFLSILENPSVEDMVRRFWEIETIPEDKKVSLEDEYCEENFQRNTFRDETGRFTLALPFKSDPSGLGDSKAMAKKRYFALESKFEKNLERKEAYHEAMANFIDQGHICPVTESGATSPFYYIPHHAVCKAKSDSTPLRIVLDASAPSSSGLSLNSVLYIGPKLQTDIDAVLIRFRLFSVALGADIKQMYRQINVIQHHRRFQRLFWRWSSEEPLRTWELKTLAFGVTSSPYLALRCVKELLDSEGRGYPEIAGIVKDNLYMDDLLVSLATVEEAANLCLQSIELFKRVQFDLTKWASNSENLLERIPVVKRAKIKNSETFETKTNILGLIWDSQKDEILINFRTPTTECTKRRILSSVARCFGPLGISAPVMLYLKSLVKELWNLKLGWDDQAPQLIQRKWKKVTTEWPCLYNLAVKGSFDLTRQTRINLLGFADASKNGFGGVVYVQNLDDPTFLQLDLQLGFGRLTRWVNLL